MSVPNCSNPFLRIILLKGNDLLNTWRNPDFPKSDNPRNLEQDYPDWVQAFSITTFDLSEIQEKLKPEEKMIYVLPGPSDQPIRLFNIESKKISFTSLNWSDSELKEILQEFRDSVGIPEEEEDITTVLNEMMDDPLWIAEKRIYVVPSGTFHFMPWGFLEDDTGRDPAYRGMAAS